MTELPTPAATRLRRPSWRDARLLGGIALVLLATALGAMGLRAADSRVQVYAAREALLPGQELTEDRLTRVNVQLSDAGNVYLAAAQGIPTDGYALREIRAGELVPKSAVGGPNDISVVPIVVSVDAASAGALVVGSQVTVYANRPVEAAGAGKDSWSGPTQVLPTATVARLTATGGFGGANSRNGVQLLVPADKVAALIGLVDDGAKFTLVPIPGSLLKDAS